MKSRIPAAVVLIVLFAVQCFAVIAVVTSEVALSVDNDTATTTGVDTTGGTAAIEFIGWFGSGSTPTPSDSKSNSYTPLTTECSTNACAKFWYVCGATVGTGHTFTSGGTTGLFPAIVGATLSGTLSASCSDGESAGAGTASATSLQPGSLTPSQNDSIVLTGCSFASAHGDATIDGGFTELEDAQSTASSEGIYLAYLVQGAAAAANPTVSWTNSVNAVCVSMAVKIAATVGGSRMSLLGVGR